LIIIDLIRHVKVEGEAALYGRTDVAPLPSDNQQLLNKLINRQLSNRQGYDVIVSSPLQRCHLLAQQLADKIDKPLIHLDDLQEMDFGIYDGIAFDQIPLVKSPSKAKAKEKLTDLSISLSSPSSKLSSCDAKLNQSRVNWTKLEEFFQAPAEVNLPQAESLLHFNQRVSEAWVKLLIEQFPALCGDKALDSFQLAKPSASTRLTQASQAKRIAIVTHGGVIRMILAEILAVDWQQPHWHQHLKIGYGSLTSITVTRPFQNESFLQQVSNIAMPLLD